PTCSLCSFFSSLSSVPLFLHSFPTRRSSDPTGFDYSASVDRVVLDSIIQSPTSATEVLSTLSPYAGTETTAFDLELGAFFEAPQDRKSTRLNSSHVKISYAVFCLKKKKS